MTQCSGDTDQVTQRSGDTVIRWDSLLVDFDDAVHNGDVSTLDLEDKDLSSLDGLVLIVGKEEEVPAVEGWLHTATTARWEGRRGEEWEERDGRR